MIQPSPSSTLTADDQGGTTASAAAAGGVTFTLQVHLGDDEGTVIDRISLLAPGETDTRFQDQEPLAILQVELAGRTFCLVAVLVTNILRQGQYFDQGSELLSMLALAVEQGMLGESFSYDDIVQRGESATELLRGMDADLVSAGLEANIESAWRLILLGVHGEAEEKLAELAEE